MSSNRSTTIGFWLMFIVIIVLGLIAVGESNRSSQTAGSPQTQSSDNQQQLDECEAPYQEQQQQAQNLAADPYEVDQAAKLSEAATKGMDSCQKQYGH